MQSQALNPVPVEYDWLVLTHTCGAPTVLGHPPFQEDLPRGRGGSPGDLFLQLFWTHHLQRPVQTQV